ncbi:MAG: hypothetical protein CMJ78_07545 [Planctomycetaceae bacterium]|nr:hypothetical protein [Planctomycetaceae bacterium]
MAIVVLVTVPPADAQEFSDLEVGFKGFYKIGEWTPLRISLTSSESSAILEVDVVDPEGCITTIQGSRGVQSEGKLAFEALFKPGRIGAGITVRAKTADDKVIAKEVLTPQSNGGQVPEGSKQSVLFIATLGEPAGFEPYRGSGTERGFGGAKFIRFQSASELPSDPRSYESLNSLVIADDYKLSDDQSEALRHWVLNGGHLILAVGTDVKEFQASLFPSWEAIPFEVESRVQVPDTRLAGLESFIGESDKILASGRINVARVNAKSGRSMIRSREGGSSIPILARSSYGFGRITFFAMDLNRPPLSNWNSAPILCEKLINTFSRRIKERKLTSNRTRLTSSGITELGTQLHAAQEEFSEIQRMSSWTVMALIVAYLLIVGPLDYLIVHKVLKRPHWTWWTLPLVIASTGLLGVVAGGKANGDRMLLNQLDVIDIDQHTNTVRTFGWMTPYSPASNRHTLRVVSSPIENGEPATLNKKQPNVSWHGLAESAFGGMYRQGGFELARPTYRFDNSHAGFESFPLMVWSTKTIESDWAYHSEGLVKSNLSSRGYGQLRGSVTHHLPGTITDWVVAYGNQVYRPRSERFRSIRPNQPWLPASTGIQMRELRGYLTRTVATQIEDSSGTHGDVMVAQSAYDPLNRDLHEIIKMLTFHDAAGGTKYTGLRNSSLAKFDLSEILTLERAVLFGKLELDSPINQLELDGESVASTRQSTFVRILVPVETVDIKVRELPDSKKLVKPQNEQNDKAAEDAKGK